MEGACSKTLASFHALRRSPRAQVKGLKRRAAACHRRWDHASAKRKRCM